MIKRSIPQQKRNLPPAKPHNPYKHLSLIRDRYAHSTNPCLIIGSGPSSARLQHTNWQDFYSISINFAQFKYPSQLLLYQDRPFLRNYEIEQHLKTHRVLTIHSSTQADRYYHDLPGWFMVKKDRDFKREIEGIEINCILSGPHAVIAAVILGLSPIIVIGLDAVPGKEYTYPRAHPLHRQRNMQAESGKGPERQYNWLKINAQRFNIINCTDADWAPQIPIEEALKGLQPNYKRCAEEMERVYLAYASDDEKQRYLAKTKQPR